MPILGTQSSLNASAYGFGGTSVSASASVTPTNLVEGVQITITVTTEGISDGTTLYYTVSGTLGTITASDFTDNTLSGSFTINNNTGSFTKTVAVDGVVEDGEAFVIQIRQDSITGSILDTTSSVYIQGSQSTGVVQIQPPVNGVEFWDFASNGNLIFDGGTSTSYTFTAATNIKFKAFIWGQGGRGGYSGTGGYSFGTFQLNTNDSIYMRLNYGPGPSRPGSGSGLNVGEAGGGLAGIFASSTISQPNARLIAGGGGGGAPPIGGSGNASGGNGGGPSGTSGGNSPDSVTGSTGGGGGSQGGGGGAGNGSGTPATPGSALQGGTGGQGSGSFPNWSGGGGGGAGWYGGGGGGGGDDFGSGTRSASGGGGGSGYVHPAVINGFTGGYPSGVSHPDRGTAGNAGTNSRIVLQGIIALEYRGLGGNEAYSVNIPATTTSITAKVWGAGGQGVGECPSGAFSGGSGGYVAGTISVTGGSTINVYVGGAGVGSKTSPYSQAGSGAGNGGGLSAVSYGVNILVAGGGGGSGQNGQGGYGGANGSGGNGSGPNNGGAGTQSGGGGGGSSDDVNGASGDFWSSGSNPVNGGNSGGSGQNQGNRGGGGGAGYYGGGGGGGYSNSNCSGGGGGGGSGIISGSWSSTSSQNGQTGTGGGRSATNSGDSNYVPGYGGSSQNGLVVLIFE